MRPSAERRIAAQLRKLCSASTTLASGKSRSKPEDVRDPRSAPAVDRLVRVARSAQVRVPLRERLRTIRYWAAFVSWYSSTRMQLIPRVELVADLAVLGQHQGDVHQEVVEVDRVRLEEVTSGTRGTTLATIACQWIPDGVQEFSRVPAGRCTRSFLMLLIRYSSLSGG